jgi:hypothetical protein
LAFSRASTPRFKVSWDLGQELQGRTDFIDYFLHFLFHGNILLVSPGKKGKEIASIPAYSGTQASTGQTSAQVAHSVHLSGSITYLGSPSLMASAGHSSLQVPHIMQSSVIL